MAEKELMCRKCRVNLSISIWQHVNTFSCHVVCSFMFPVVLSNSAVSFIKTVFHWTKFARCCSTSVYEKSEFIWWVSKHNGFSFKRRNQVCVFVVSNGWILKIFSFNRKNSLQMINYDKSIDDSSIVWLKLETFDTIDALKIYF